MLMPYLVRYRLSRRFNLSHGNDPQAWQYLALPSWKVSQFLIPQSQRLGGFPSSGPRQPGHLFLCLRKATQMAQFIPQGAISELLCVDTATLLYCADISMRIFYHPGIARHVRGRRTILLKCAQIMSPTGRYKDYSGTMR